MATQTLPDVTVENTWVDLVAVEPSLAGAAVIIQVISVGKVQIVFGGSQPASGKTGIVLGREDSVKGDAAAVWARSYTPSTKVSLTLV